MEVQSTKNSYLEVFFDIKGNIILTYLNKCELFSKKIQSLSENEIIVNEDSEESKLNNEKMINAAKVKNQDNDNSNQNYKRSESRKKTYPNFNNNNEKLPDIPKEKLANIPNEKIADIPNEKIVGFKVPMFKEAVDLVKEAAKVVPEIGYVGWDVAISEKGPVLVEGNCYPGVFQVKPSLVEKKEGIIPKYNKVMKIF